jgi:hypothetical protein
MSTFAYTPPAWFLYAHLLTTLVAVAGCGTTKEVHRKEAFESNTPYSMKIKAPSKVVCWSVKKAFLSQGYMLDRTGADTPTLTGVKDFQVDNDTNVNVRLQTSCADNNDGSTTVFATASREVSEMQRERQHTSAGVAWATVTVPSGSAKVLRTVSRETINDSDFYQRFYALVRQFAQEEVKSQR